MTASAPLAAFVAMSLYSIILAGCPAEPTEGPSASVPQSPQTAPSMQAVAGCTPQAPRRGVVEFSWNPKAAPAEAQRVEYTNSVDGFQRGEFSTSPNLPPEAGSWSLSPTLPDVDYHWRVARVRNATWTAGETAAVRAVLCAGDIHFVSADDRSLRASGLTASAKCDENDPRVGVAVLHWSPAEAGGEQRVVVGILPNVFDTGLFDVSSPLERRQSEFEWKPLAGRATHYWKVLTRGSAGWIASETATVQGVPCIADSVG